MPVEAVQPPTDVSITESPLQPADQTRPLASWSVYLLEHRQAFGHRRDHLHAGPFGGRRQQRLILSPHQQRARRRIEDDVETIFRSIVDDEIKIERVGDAAARALNHEHARQREPVRLQPALGLHLRGRACRLGSFCQEDQFPAALVRERRKPRHHAWLDLLQRLPESVDRFDVAPEPALLAVGHLHLRETRRGRLQRLGSHREIGRICRLAGAGERRGTISPNKRLGVSDQLRFHVGEHAVEITSDAKRHLKARSSDGLGKPEWVDAGPATETSIGLCSPAWSGSAPPDCVPR